MSESENIANQLINHAIVAVIIDAALVIWLIKTSWEGNDKAIILVIFFYPLLIVVNGLVWSSACSVNCLLLLNQVLEIPRPFL